MKRLLLILSIVFLTACGDPKIDASSQESLKKSGAEMTKNLSREESKKLQIALMRVTMESMMQARGDEQKGFEALKMKIHGKTADEIIKQYGEK